jgi:glycosyltransferase involved in cell wall biosynthesis
MSSRVIHIVESLGNGATENWLLRMLSHARSLGSTDRWSFYCTLPTVGSKERQAIELGASVIVSPVAISKPAHFASALRNELAKGGYEVMHSHHDLISGFYLAATLGIPLRRRIVHVHNAGDAIPTGNRVKQLLYTPLLRRTTLALADRIVGVSNHTLDTFLGGRPRRPERDWVRYCGVDARPFLQPPPDRREFRRSLGLPGDANIMLFAGRLVPEKNPAFTLDVLFEMRRLDASAVAVFAGSGSEEETILARAQALGLKDHIRFLGWRDDIASIMRCADWFMLPSPERPMEGFGLAVVEAQLAGLRLLVSHGIPDDPLLPTAVYRRLSLKDAPEKWSKAAFKMLHESAPCCGAALAALRQSPMDMDFSLRELLGLYQ